MITKGNIITLINEQRFSGYTPEKIREFEQRSNKDVGQVRDYFEKVLGKVTTMTINDVSPQMKKEAQDLQNSLKTIVDRMELYNDVTEYNKSDILSNNIEMLDNYFIMLSESLDLMHSLIEVADGFLGRELSKRNSER